MLALVAVHTSAVLISRLQLVSSKLCSYLARLDIVCHLYAFRKKHFSIRGVVLFWSAT